MNSYFIRTASMDKRARELREALKMTKTEVARRAQLSVGQYANIESPRPTKNRYSFRQRVRTVRRSYVAQAAIALGVTTEFLAIGNTATSPAIAPNDPRRSLLAQIAQRNKEIVALKAKVAKQVRAIENANATIDNLTKMGATIAETRIDDAGYFRELSVDAHDIARMVIHPEIKARSRKLGDQLWDAYRNIKDSSPARAERPTKDQDVARDDDGVQIEWEREPKDG